MVVEGKRRTGGMVCPKEGSYCLTTQIRCRMPSCKKFTNFLQMLLLGKGSLLKPSACFSPSGCRMSICYSFSGNAPYLPPRSNVCPCPAPALLQPLPKFPEKEEDLALTQEEWLSTF